VRSYFQIRRLAWKGEKASLEYLEAEEPGVFRNMVEFYGTQDLRHKLTLLHGLTRKILAPVGGMWQEDDLLTFGEGEGEDLQERGRALFGRLFERDPQVKKRE
jgi:hypothetical protein